MVTTTGKSEVTLYGLDGRDRAMLYQVAVNTGLRASELASLTPTSLDLDSPTPTVRCLGAYTKNGQEAVLPLRAELAKALDKWLDGRPAEGPLWPGNWSQFNSAKVIRADLAAAREAWMKTAKTAEAKQECERSSFLKYADASGRYADFHSLRHTFISNLAKAGVHPKNAQALADTRRRGAPPPNPFGYIGGQVLQLKLVALPGLPVDSLDKELAEHAVPPGRPLPGPLTAATGRQQRGGHSRAGVGTSGRRDVPAQPLAHPIARIALGRVGTVAAGIDDHRPLRRSQSTERLLERRQ